MARLVAQQLTRDAGQGANFLFEAAGTHALSKGEAMDPRARSVLAKHHYAVDSTRSRRVSADDFERFDWVLAMDKSNHSDLEKLCPAHLLSKLQLLLDYAPAQEVREVPDPYFGNVAGFERVLYLCELAVEGFLKKHSVVG